MLGCLNKSLKRTLRRMLRAESGATAIEFAMVAPVVIMLIAVMLETGVMQFSEFALQSGVQRAARDVKIGTAQGKGNAINDFRDRICSLASVGVKCSDVNVYLQNYSGYKNMYDTAPNYTDVGNIDPVTNTKLFKFSCGTSSQPMLLIATYDWKFSIPYFMRPLGNINGGDTRRLVGVTIFQNEPFPGAGTCK